MNKILDVSKFVVVSCFPTHTEQELKIINVFVVRALNGSYRNARR